MKELINNLLKLQSLELGGQAGPGLEKQIAGLRAGIPAPILGHYDRLAARGKKGVAAVSNQVCTGCHMQVPRGAVLTLMRGEDVQICDNCGRYLHLPEQPEVESPEAPAKTKPPRGRRALLQTV